MTIKECYEKVGSDYDGVLKRLGSEALVKRFAVKFLNDPSFQELTDGLAAQDGEKAFRAAHTLKGVCLNLGFTELYKVSAELTEVLRGRVCGEVFFFRHCWLVLLQMCMRKSWQESARKLPLLFSLLP